MEPILLKATSTPMSGKVTGNSHHYKLSPIWLPSVMNSMDKGRAVGVYPDLQQKHTEGVDGKLTMAVKNGVDFYAQASEVTNLKSWRQPTASAVPQVFFLTHVGSGIEHTQMTANNAARGQEQQSPKHGRRELPFSWIFPG